MKHWTLVAGPLVALGLGIGLSLAGWSSGIAWTAGITMLTACWWIFEPIPIPATSLIPLAVLPLVGVISPTQVGEAYGSPLILLLLGGFMLSSAMERSGAHRRIALSMVGLFGGGSGRRLVFGFMTASAVLSMWISNMATTLMLLPVVMALIEKINDSRLRVALLLGIAYAASVGGVGTPVGTPPNLIFMKVYAENFGTEPSFLEWMSWAIPVVLVMIPCVALWLTRGLKPHEPIELPEVGPWRPAEVRTLLIFGITALLWVTRTAPGGGWSGFLHLPYANDASVALLAVVVMFIVPNGSGGRLLDWKTAAGIPWGILILFGSGIAIAKAFVASQLSVVLGELLAGFVEASHPLVLIGVLCFFVMFLTEITSNTATTTLLMPILAAAALTVDIDPKLIMVPATISASFAFMLPVATGPNAVVFGSRQLTVRTMAREGLALNVIGTVVVTGICYLLFA